MKNRNDFRKMSIFLKPQSNENAGQTVVYLQIVSQFISVKLLRKTPWAPRAPAVRFFMK